MFLSESKKEKWKEILEHQDLPAIKDAYRRDVTACLLENQDIGRIEEILEMHLREKKI